MVDEFMMKIYGWFFRITPAGKSPGGFVAELRTQVYFQAGPLSSIGSLLAA
jgi:hypothetical protein